MAVDLVQSWKTSSQEDVLHEIQCVDATKFLTKASEVDFCWLVQIKTLEGDARNWTQLWTSVNGYFSQNTVQIMLQIVHRTSLELKSTCI